jgi:hypothetical protein
MSSRTKLPAVLLIAGLLAGGSSTAAVQAPSDSEGAPPGNSARFRQVATASPAVPTSVYAPYVGPYAGYWSGMADIVTNMLAPREGSLQKEQVRQAKVDTRRKRVDQFLYEREVMPTVEDDRERARVERVRRSRNDPPLTEIWSGYALNGLLDAIQKQRARNIPGPNVGLDQEMLKHINVTSGAQGGGSIGLLRDDGKISWPRALSRGAYKDTRTKVDQSAYQAYRQAQSGPVDGDLLDGLTRGVEALFAQLKDNVSETSTTEYVTAKRFLNELENTVKALQDPKVSSYFTGNFAAKGNTVAELTSHMTRQGLKFAPATNSDEEAYVALHQAMVAYVAPPDRSWDPLAK